MMLARRALYRFCPIVQMLEDRALLNAGGLDTSYGGTGEVAASPGFTVTGLAVAHDLETVVVGLEPSSTTPYDNTVIVQYNVNGTLDSSFGSGGTVVLATNTEPTATVHPNHNVSVAVQPNGQIVVATDTTTYEYTAPTKKNPATYTITAVSMMVVRLNANGSLDTSFGNGGEAVIAIPKAFEGSEGVAVLSSGEIVVAGTNISSTYTGPEFVVARLTVLGALDTMFGPNGQGYNGLPYTTPPQGYQSDGVSALAIDGSGNILVGGLAAEAGPPIGDPYQVVRYTANGLLDTTFANGGVYDLYKTYVFYGVGSIAFQSDGQIILGLPLWQPDQPAVVRLNTNGTIDTTFGTNGFYLETTGSIYATAAVQPDDKILLGVGVAEVGEFEVDRLLPDGTLDSTFGTGGKSLQTVPGDIQCISEGLVIGPDGRITGAYGNGTFRLLNDITSNVAVTVGVSSPSSGALLLGALTPDLVDSALSSKWFHFATKG